MMQDDLSTSSNAVGSDWSASPPKLGFGKMLAQRYQLLLDKSVPYVIPRWIAAILFLAGFFLRVMWVRGWYIIAYALAIYLLNVLLAFLTPKIDPAMSDFADDGMQLPTHQSAAGSEFKPFIRRLPEFKAWHTTMIATTVALLGTCFHIFNIPVYAPVLVLYFFMLFFLTMRRQIQHMIRYRYLPFTFGKPKYAKGAVSSQ